MMLLTKAENIDQMSNITIDFHLTATDPQLLFKAFSNLMFPKPVSQLESLQTSAHVLPLLFGLPLTHICYLQSNLEQLPHLPQECALSMTISRTLCLNPKFPCLQPTGWNWVSCQGRTLGNMGSPTTISPPLECMLYDCKDFYVSFTEVSYVFIIVPGT